MWFIVVLWIAVVNEPFKDRQDVELRDTRIGAIWHCQQEGERISKIITAVLGEGYMVGFRCKEIPTPKGWEGWR